MGRRGVAVLRLLLGELVGVGVGRLALVGVHRREGVGAGRHVAVLGHGELRAVEGVGAGRIGLVGLAPGPGVAALLGLGVGRNVDVVARLPVHGVGAVGIADVGAALGQRGLDAYVCALCGQVGGVILAAAGEGRCREHQTRNKKKSFHVFSVVIRFDTRFTTTIRCRRVRCRRLRRTCRRR